MKNTILLLLLICSVSASAAMPHVFQANTPAKASEVNNNFSYLENKINAIDPQASEVAIKTGVTYNFIEVSPGTEVIIGGTSYYLMKAPYFEGMTGRNFVITYLTTSSYSAPTLPIYNYRENIRELNPSGLAEQILTGSTPLYVTSYCTYQMNGSLQVGSCGTTVYIEIGNGTLGLSVEHTEAFDYSDAVSADDYDLTDDGPLITLPAYNNDEYLDIFIDYISVEEISL